MRACTLKVVTPKTLVVKIGAKKPVKREITALDVRDALAELHVKVGKHDEVSPRLGKTLDDGDRIVFTDVRVVTRRDRDQAIDFGTVTRSDSSLLEGKSRTVRAGRAGVRDVTYRLTFRNGRLDTHQGRPLRRRARAGQRGGRQRHQAAPAAARAGARARRELRPPAAPSGTGSPRASPAATGPRTPATATTAACSSASAPGRRTAAPAVPT